jgi:hypothetical protein
MQECFLPEFGSRNLKDVTDDDLQDLLKGKAAGLSFSAVDHLKWGSNCA